MLCGGGLPVVLALLESGLCGPCGGAERGHAPSPGAAGLEAAFDAALSGTGEGDTLTCLVNAQGKLRETPEQTHADSGAVGVQLTLSRDVQRAAEAVASG